MADAGTNVLRELIEMERTWEYYQRVTRERRRVWRVRDRGSEQGCSVGRADTRNRAAYVVSEEDKAALRAMMPDFLRVRLGITDLRRPFRCPAPDHEDKNPSARYFVDGAVHCFGCGRTWDVFSLVRETDGVVGFADQAQAVADVVGYHLSAEPCSRPTRPAAPRRKRPAFGEPRELAAVDVTAACRDAHWALYTQAGAVARRYLRSRGLDDGDAERLGPDEAGVFLTHGVQHQDRQDLAAEIAVTAQLHHAVKQIHSLQSFLPITSP